MKVAVEKIENQQVVLTIEVDQAEVKKALDRTYDVVGKRVNIPGFRKGKVPRTILKQRLGEEGLLYEAFDTILAPKAYNEALAQEGISPVGQPAVEIVTLAADKDLVFKATVTPKPEVTLGEYKGIKVKKEVAEVTEEQIGKQIEAAQNKNAKMVVAEGAQIAKGDFAIIDFKGFVDGEAFAGGEGKGYPLEIGPGTFIPRLEDQLIGAKAGDEIDVNVTFPQQYQADLAGKDALFKVTVQDVKRKELPAVDDELAKDAGFDTVDAWKADIRAKLEKDAEERSIVEFRAAAIKQAMDNTTVEIPAVMVEERIDYMVQNFSVNLESYGMKLEDYLAQAQMDIEALRASYKDSAEVNVKTDMMLEKIAKVEELKVNPNDLDAEIAMMAQSYGAKAEEVAKIIKEQNRVNDLIATVLRKKAAALVVEHAVAE